MTKLAGLTECIVRDALFLFCFVSFFFSFIVLTAVYFSIKHCQNKSLFFSFFSLCVYRRIITFNQNLFINDFFAMFHSFIRCVYPFLWCVIWLPILSILTIFLFLHRLSLYHFLALRYLPYFGCPWVIISYLFSFLSSSVHLNACAHMTNNIISIPCGGASQRPNKAWKWVTNRRRRRQKKIPRVQCSLFYITNE